MLPVALPCAGVAVPSTGSVLCHFCLLEHSCFLLTWAASAPQGAERDRGLGLGLGDPGFHTRLQEPLRALAKEPQGS